jgi:uncharacterized lipoprotein YddW (UPF0748 family)
MTSKIVPAPRTGHVPFGVWIHGLQPFLDADEMRRFVERLVTNGVDILFPCVKQATGFVDYPSSIAVQSDETQGHDPLQTLCDVAPEFGLKVHAWLCNFIEGKGSALLNAHPELQAMQNSPVKGLQSERPEMWAESNRWACCNHPMVLDYETSLMQEVADRYPVQGVHFDYVRSGFYQCYCDYCRAKCQEMTGADLVTQMGNFHPLARTWYDWRADNISSFVRRVGDHVHPKGMETSAAVFCVLPLSYNEQAQDWPRWLQEGWLDLAIPMTYSTIPRETHLYTLNHAAVARDAGRGEMWEGIYVDPCSDELFEEIAAEAVSCGAGGVTVFQYHALTDEKFARFHAGVAQGLAKV